MISRWITWFADNSGYFARINATVADTYAAAVLVPLTVS
ncbi:Subtilisin-like serine protease pepC [Carbonactinospora thermoautotrophica]|uniref:Subtilisin-like serine protease pepC n=1 Tax=Carbonactinospora thermoautotrophica TaxID=1469144 RepID=A0A132MVC6_9ACTN|nr:Subtilisin-like serine protease pepC [Carbonactinospora thermoautotrophica]